MKAASIPCVKGALVWLSWDYLDSLSLTLIILDNHYYKKQVINRLCKAWASYLATRVFM